MVFLAFLKKMRFYHIWTCSPSIYFFLNIPPVALFPPALTMGSARLPLGRPRRGAPRIPNIQASGRRAVRVPPDSHFIFTSRWPLCRGVSSQGILAKPDGAENAEAGP